MIFAVSLNRPTGDNTESVLSSIGATQANPALWLVPFDGSASQLLTLLRRRLPTASLRIYEIGADSAAA